MPNDYKTWLNEHNLKIEKHMVNGPSSSYTKVLDPIYNHIIKSTTSKKIIHYTGHLDHFSCKACGIYRDNKSIDIWVVMKKTWLQNDSSFIRCSKVSKWDPKVDKILFIDAPTTCPKIPVVDIRKDLIEIMIKSIYGSRLSRNASTLLYELEVNAFEIFLAKIKKEIPLMLNPYNPENQELLLKILKAAYVNS